MDQSTQGNFQKIFMIVGFVVGVLGVFVFSVSTFNANKTDPNLSGVALVWGTLPAEQMNQILYEYSQSMKTFSVQYVEKDPSKIISNYVEEVALGRGPDLLLVPEDISTPLASQYLAYFGENLMPEKLFKEKYVRSTYKLYSPKGVYAFPVGIDPLIMYVNTDILTNAGFSKAPSSWSDVPLYVSRVLGFIKTDENTVQRALAMGTVNNIYNYRELLLTLLMQLKNNVIEYGVEPEVKKDPITGDEFTAYTDKYQSVFGLSNEEQRIKNDALAEQVFVFFTSFVNPAIKDAYTWSKKAPIDRDLFTSGNLGLSI
jgi:ABC-type glycerol-3-phosphate transport system substrate-binding protein